MPSRQSPLESYTTARGLPRFEILVEHPELNKVQAIRGDDAYVVRQKAAAKRSQWDELWGKQEQKRQRAEKREHNESLAVERTQEAQAVLDECNLVLVTGVGKAGPLRWDALVDRSSFDDPLPEECSPRAWPPSPSGAQFSPKLSLFDRLWPGRSKRLLDKSDRDYQRALANWSVTRDEVNAANEADERRYSSELDAWNECCRIFAAEQQVRNDAMTAERERYENGEEGSVVSYSELVLSVSDYPAVFPKSWELQYVRESKTLIVDYQLPSPDDMPRLQEVRYVVSRKALSEKDLSKVEFNRMYGSVLYQIALRTAHELLISDVRNAVDSIVFNGRVHMVDPGTGNEVDKCVLSLQTTKKELLSINLEQVDPKQCFKRLKGIGSGKLHALVAVAPIVTMERDDSRFVASKDVVAAVDEGDNLAAMDWEDFEHLVRELFQSEFAANGGEVKVTRASRDGGIDAVVFDPDPIRGGKIVIQAKRYTNLVDVSAVRDLYGTTVNEGAMKGILVTTADFGPDSYEFAKDKPLTLMNGANLLHLLEKHGHRARIDIGEAKRRAREERGL